jgi:transcriptional regulator with XRE-family HTH domain
MKRPISEIRRDSGVIQKDAAEILGVAQSTWSRYERADVRPNRRTLSRAAMIEAVRKVAASQGSGIQVHLEDLVGVPKKRRRG